MKQIIIFFFTVNIILAQSDVPLTLRAQFNGSYGYTIIGNTHNQFDNWQNPTPPCQMLTQSTASLNLASNQTIVAAYLYWSGIDNGNLDTSVTLNNINYLATQTSVSYPYNFSAFSFFGVFKDVSNQLINSGNGLFTFSDFNLNPIISNYCSSAIYYSGWSIVVVYSQVGLPNQQINIYDGLNIVGQQFNNGITSLTIDNLNVTDNQNAKISYVVWNGSPNLFSNESISLNGNILGNTENPANNPFNGTNSFTGNSANWNQDIDTFDVSPFVNIGDIQANVVLSSNATRLLQTLITSIRSELPDATAQITSVTGQEICNNRNLNLSFKLKNTNANAPLPIGTPIALYADTNLLTTVSTTTVIPVGGEVVFNVPVTIPNTVPNNFTIKVVSNSNGLATPVVAESNNNNNEATVGVSLIDNIIPTFNVSNVVCQNATSVVLPTTSTNGITGAWSPNVIDNQNPGTYVFTPNVGQCAISYTLNTTITPAVTPSFSIPTTFCQNSSVPILPTTSINTITGTWSPNVIDNQNSGTYVFTPNVGQCAINYTLNTTITPAVTPSFSIPTAFCQNSSVPILPTTSTNAITGTWSPNVIDNQNSGTYVFTPNVGQCAINYTLNTTITPAVTPSFSIPTAFCQNSSVPILPTTSTNAITGTWSPNVIDNQNSGTYIFTPNTGQCSSNFTLNTTIYPNSGFMFNYNIANDFDTAQIITVQVTGGTGPFLYSFNGLPFQNNNNYQTNPYDSEILVKVKEAADIENCFVADDLVVLWKYPKFFTPNGDGYNDTWGINSEKEIKIEIFDRFGKLLKILKNNENWNGTFNQQSLPASDYWFVIYYNSKVFRSHFSLKR